MSPDPWWWAFGIAAFVWSCYMYHTKPSHRRAVGPILVAYGVGLILGIYLVIKEAQ